MINKKEIIAISIAIAVLIISTTLISSWKIFLITGLSVIAVVLINITTKKAVAYYLDTDIEMKLWKIKRYGFKPEKELKRPFPAGIFFPLLFSALTYGGFVWMASLIFKIKPKVYKAAKRHGLYSYLDVTEYQIGLIAAAGIVINLIFAVIGYLIGWTTFSQLNIWYAFFNIIPFSDLDGNKIFFGNLVLWSFLTSIVILGIAYSFILA